MYKASLPLFALLVLAFPAKAQTPEIAPTTLEITAEANVKAAPDIADISAGVVTQAATANAALKENSDKMTSVHAALKKAGIAEKDIQTSGVTLNPQYVYNNNEPPRITGYQASNTVTVLLRDMENIGVTLDTLVAASANQINGPNFMVENSDDLLDKARSEAVRKAQKRAGVYASAAGLKVKRIAAITEQSQIHAPPRPMMMKAMAMDMAESSTPVSPGQLDLGVSVTIKYELAP